MLDVNDGAGRCRITVSDAWTKNEMLVLRGDRKLKPRAI